MFTILQKTVCLLLGSRQKLIQVDKFEISLDNEIIKMVESQKLLVVLPDKNHTWDKQINAVCLNITRRTILLKFLSKYIHITTMDTYYNSYILPILDYGCLMRGGVFTWKFT